MTSRRVVFIDERVRGHDALIETLSHDTTWHVLSGQEDGVSQIQQALANHHELESIHVVSHGASGTLYLGDTVLTADNLSVYRDAFESIGATLQSTGDLLLYGCDVAHGNGGIAFIESIAELTGATVAASTNRSGPRALGGDSILEHKTGSTKASTLDLEALTETLDTTRDDGIVTTTVGSNSLGSHTLGAGFNLMNNGKILAVGYAGETSSASNLALVRYNADGSLDTSFGDDGLFMTPLAVLGTSVVVQPDDKILVAGISLSGYSGYEIKLLRFNSDGNLDLGFSDDGIVTSPFVSNTLPDGLVKLQSDGKILLASNTSDEDFSVTRYNSDGSLDTGFGTNGSVTTSISTYDTVRSMIVQSDDKIILAGHSTTTGFGGSFSDDISLVRYESDGSLDTSFGQLGIVTTRVGSLEYSYYDYGMSVALGPNDEIVVAGSSFDGNGSWGVNDFDVAVVKYNTDGSLDTSFAGIGAVVTDIGANQEWDEGRSVTVQTDGKVLVAGWSSNGANYDFFVARYNVDGSLDAGFGNQGVVILDISQDYDVAKSVMVQPDGKILVGGASRSGVDGDQIALVRLNSDGSLDTSFDATPSDTVAPSISSFSPTDDATDVAVDSSIVLTFDEAIERGTGTILLTVGSESGVPIYNIDELDVASSHRVTISGSTLTIKPIGELANGTKYLVSLPAGMVKDTAGNSFAGYSTYDFRTVVGADNTLPSIDTFGPPGGSIPNGSTGLLVNSDIVLTFSEDIERGSGLITLRSGSESGSIVEQFEAATSPNLSIDGMILTIDLTNNLDYDTQYFLTLDSGTFKDLAGNLFPGSSAYGSPAYNFTTEALVDTTAPTLEFLTPANGSTGVAIDSNIVLTFSEEIDSGTGFVTLRSESATGPIIEEFDVQTSEKITISGSTLTIDPTDQLNNGTLYIVTLDPGSFVDLEGNVFAGSSTYDFTTISSVDTSPPRISAFSPNDGATSVAVGSDIVLTFNEDIQRGTGTVLLTEGSASGPIIDQLEIATSSRATISGSKLTINPMSDLANGTQYFLTLPGGAVQDLAGNSFAGLSTYDFTTVTSIVGGADTDLVEFDFPFIKMESVGLTPDGKSMVVKVDGTSITIPLDIEISFSDISKLARELLDLFEPIAVFTSIVNDKTEYILPELFTGPASLNLKYQLIDETINAVVRGSNENEFIKLANTNSTGKAADGMDGDDVIDGGVGSTFATGGGGSNTFFLDGRAEGVSWSTITDFKLGIDKATIWGWKQGVSKVSFIDEQGGADGYQGLTLHFENLLPDDAAPGQVNLQLNSITLTGLKLSDFGVSSLEELNALIAAGGNGNFQVGSVSDEYGDHGYLFLN